MSSSSSEANYEEDAIDAACAALLLQTILAVGGVKQAALSGLVGLLDRYNDVLRGIALPENERAHAVLTDGPSWSILTLTLTLSRCS